MTNKNGRPPIGIDKESFEGLCEIQCTQEDIARFFKCSVDTITRWCKKTYGCTFADILAQKKEVGKMSLRRMQWKAAESGNVTMLIWLGKNMLEQSDSTNVTLNNDKPFEINVNVLEQQK